MASIESNKVTVSSSKEQIFKFLSNLNNLEKLMPLDKISDWTSTEEMCKLKIKGMGGLGMKLKSKTEHSLIVLESLSDKPFSFELKITLEDSNSNTNVQMLLDAEINPFMKMMVEKPLKNFFDSLAEKLQHVEL